jgi:hypothetical protein
MSRQYVRADRSIITYGVHMPRAETDFVKTDKCKRFESVEFGEA